MVNEFHRQAEIALRNIANVKRWRDKWFMRGMCEWKNDLRNVEQRFNWYRTEQRLQEQKK